MSSLWETLADASSRAALDPPEVAADGRPLLGDAAALAAHVAAGLAATASPLDPSRAGPSPRAVGASVALQAAVAQLATAALLAPVLAGERLQVRARDVRWRPLGFGTRYGLTGPVGASGAGAGAASLGEVIANLIEELGVPAVAALGAVATVDERLLWGDVATALWTGVAVRHRFEPLARNEIDAVTTAVAANVAFPGLVSEVQDVGGRLRWRRSTCCLIVHAAPFRCDECPSATRDALRIPIGSAGA